MPKRTLKPATQPSQPPSRSWPPRELTVHVIDSEDFVGFIGGLLTAGCYAWQAAHARRFVRLGDLPMRRTPPWRVWRQRMFKATTRFWKAYTDFEEPKPHPRNYHDRCFRAITWVLLTLMTMTKNTSWNPSDLPFAFLLVKGPLPQYGDRPLTATTLAHLMELEDDGLSFEVCYKYARLWFTLRQRFSPPT